MLNSWLQKPSVREFLLLNLINHRVADRDVEWWARCKLNHTAAFPYLGWDDARLAAGLIIYAAFANAILLGIFAAGGFAIIARQIQIEKRIASRTQSHRQNYASYRDLVIVRALFWGGVTAVGLSIAPPAYAPIIAMSALFIMFVDALCMVAMPRRAILATAIYAAATTVPLVAFHSGPVLMAAILACSGFVFLHWAVFNLHFLFATRRLRTRRLREASETIQLLLNQYDEDGSDWLFECDEGGRILRPNARFCKAAARSAEELNGMRLSLLFDDCPERDELRVLGEKEDNFRGLVIPLTIEGESCWWSISARPIYDSEGNLDCWRGFMADISRSRRAEAKVTYMAHYDVLTNLPNRSLFNTTLRRAFDRQDHDQILGILYVDLDHFKAINDTHGHAIGDTVLAEAGRRIEQAVGNSNMVARLGGDEFAVLLDRLADRQEALGIAQAIVSAMDDPIEIDGQVQPLPIGASVGVAFAPDNGLTGEDVLKAADLALYDAKSRGRSGASVFDPGMQQEVQDRRALELDLRAALSRGELEVQYQPLKDAATTETVGYEALLRWHHPERGDVSPAVFIPIAEETGQIMAIGSWVLREALNEAANWPEHLTVSVNLSPAQMRDEGLLNTIVGALAASGVAPQRLELEITESLLMQDNDENIELLHRIRDIGVQIALDDFGTGYSSLNYLRSFPFDRIKIDRCFVRDIANKEDSDAIVNAVVGLAGKLKMRTTAEGVEHSEQLERIRATGCTSVQGFLFDHARPPAELEHGAELRAARAKPAKVSHLKAAATDTETQPGKGRKSA